MTRRGGAWRTAAPTPFWTSDTKDAESLGVKGSPTMILNQGRQKLFGNLGYRIIEANIEELLREPDPDQASWC